jgi:GAF domain-containing protein
VATETRFTGPDLLRDHDVASGISATIGPAHNPWGVLGVHDTERREFRPNDAFFVQTVATILGTAIERRERERAIESQRERLAALNNLNEVVREVTDAAVEQSTRDEIEETVCRHLADSESYLFAWIGDVDPATQRVRYRAEAGTGDYLDGTVISVDPDDERSEGPSGLAFRTGEIQTTHDVHEDPRFEPWRDHIRQYDFRSSASIPIVHEGTVYGTLNVYAERPDAFEGAERAVVGQLGEVVGHAIAAAERKQALMSDEVVELEFHIPNVFDALGVDATPTGRITLHHTISIGDDKFVVYGTADDDAVADMRAIAGALPHWDEITFRDGSDGREFELVLSEPPVLSVIASVGGSVDRAVIEDGDYRLTIATSPHVNVRRIIDTVKDTYSAARLVRREQVSRSEGSTEQVHRTLMNDLTDRQRTALEAAYHGGFFKWPRDASGEDIASTLGVSAPTFHQHLRKAERKVFDRLFSTTSPATSGPVEA